MNKESIGRIKEKINKEYEEFHAKLYSLKKEQEKIINEYRKKVEQKKVELLKKDIGLQD